MLSISFPRATATVIAVATLLLCTVGLSPVYPTSIFDLPGNADSITEEAYLAAVLPVEVGQQVSYEQDASLRPMLHDHSQGKAPMSYKLGLLRSF